MVVGIVTTGLCFWYVGVVQGGDAHNPDWRGKSCNCHRPSTQGGGWKHILSCLDHQLQEYIATARVYILLCHSQTKQLPAIESCLSKTNLSVFLSSSLLCCHAGAPCQCWSPKVHLTFVHVQYMSYICPLYNQSMSLPRFCPQFVLKSN